ncbi:AAC(3) family N-acetyltransferase [Caulobacter sp. 17J65-9]|uniref:AAC(3) family N-acetyltransferase n=1 Tax=Caulobacter sp. 17J65-9 TaxID=2709382 RepID=UPI0013CB9B5B|nr:AAC(3) family N-acetyltransferase [Caulobacter sp. 17J65-9]NEX92563.1 AAC(3) family N-acetyltransferase [Caulobacter sp. 17J65-9]
MPGRTFRPSEIADQLAALGVRKGGVLLVHTAFRQVRPVEGGPAGLIEGLRLALGPEGTLVLPSFTDRDDDPFDPDTTPAGSDLGATPELFRTLPGVVRSRHYAACAALGPLAEAITRGPPPIPPHGPDSPIGRVHDLDGQVLLLGVGHDANTTLHLAEAVARVPYGVPRRFTVLRDGQPKPVDYREPDHCCEGFARMDEWLEVEGLQAEGPVGHAHARLMRAQDVVRIAVERLRAEPLAFLHGPAAGCEECDVARASVG